jgi:hypothetical protein
MHPAASSTAETLPEDCVTDSILADISTIATMAATIALAWFGGVQIAEGKRDRRARRQAALDALWVDAARLTRLLERWREISLQDSARSQELANEKIAAFDWGLLTTLLAAVGADAAVEGSIAYASLNDIALDVGTFSRALEYRDELVRKNASAVEIGAETAQAERLLKKIRKRLEATTVGLIEAVAHGNPDVHSAAMRGLLSPSVTRLREWKLPD